MLAEGFGDSPEGTQEGRRVRALALGRETKDQLRAYILGQGIWWTWCHRAADVPYGSCHDHFNEHSAAAKYNNVLLEEQ